ncbi:MAG: AraC family transcriptional regulator [Cyclobacteriaceae bacterium]|nr:AraC family transcriptional regulator [Cyclobacteriaceae bacterium]
MSPYHIILVVISGLGVIHGIFLALFLWGYKKGNSLSNKLLSGLLIILSFRVGKSVLLEFTDSIDIKIIFVGLSTIMAIGPLYYFFVLSCTRKSFRLTPKHFLHFIPAVIGLVIGLQLEAHHTKTLPLGIFVTLFISYYLHFLIYLLFSYWYVLQQKMVGLSVDTFVLLRLFFYGLLIIWGVYVLNLFDDVIPYVVGPILYSVVAYVISFIVISKGYIPKIDHSKYKTNPISDDQSDHIYAKTLKLVVDERQFQNTSLTLKSLSESLHVSPQVLSQVINQKSGKNFNSFVNAFRIEESKRLLHREEFKNQTIASIAFDVGFNSLSSFNTAFKRETGETPMAYRKQLSK